MYKVFSYKTGASEMTETGITYEDTFSEEFDSTLKKLDCFVYYAQLFQIVRSCKEELVSFSIWKKNDFWMANKYLLNYVNAVYSFREYTKDGVYSDHKTMVDIDKQYYERYKWYTFICNYRNRITHQSALIKDYAQ